PCIEYDVPDNEALELSIIENIQRKDLDIYEQAYSLKSLSEIYGYTHQDIAQKIGKSRVTVTELIRVTDLPPNVIQQCTELNINSKTFLLELVKLEDVAEMLDVLKNYAEKPFSRDKIKEKRKGEDDAEVNSNNCNGNSNGRGIKFQFTTEDKAIKIKFDIKSQDTDKNKIIEILEQLINDLRENKINFKELNA
ncbi:MAG TPA: ParB/RepB/Spo0J family partition protein, partial [Candidatus Kapabacteria bacterium]|nr:ParB/RepB/Spo0J family partition protein [Candidatus Kapabacteria bacterium]